MADNTVEMYHICSSKSMLMSGLRSLRMLCEISSRSIQINLTTSNNHDDGDGVSKALISLPGNTELMKFGHCTNRPTVLRFTLIEGAVLKVIFEGVIHVHSLSMMFVVLSDTTASGLPLTKKAIELSEKLMDGGNKDIK